MADLEDSSPGDEAGEPAAAAAEPRRRSSAGRRSSLVLLGGDDRVRREPSRRTSSQSTNLFFICLNVGEVAIMALPLTLIVITGEIDLSVASILGLSRRSDGRALQARLADLAGDDRGRRPRRVPRARSTASWSRASGCRRSR